MSKKKQKPFSVVYKKYSKDKAQRLNKALSRREKLLISYYKKYILNKPKKKKKGSKPLEKDYQ